MKLCRYDFILSINLCSLLISKTYFLKKYCIFSSFTKKIQNVFMAVSLDTYDEETGVHPRNKVIPSKRLATAGLNIAYGLKEFPSNGPFPTNFDIFLRPSYGIQVDIAYDQPFIWNATESEGFYLCMEPSFADCMLKKNIGLWQKVN